MLAWATYSQNGNPTFRRGNGVNIHKGLKQAHFPPMRRNKECSSKELLSDFIPHLCCLRGDLCWSILRPRIQILSWETRSKVQHRLLASGEGRNLQQEQWNLLRGGFFWSCLFCILPQFTCLCCLLLGIDFRVELVRVLCSLGLHNHVFL